MDPEPDLAQQLPGVEMIAGDIAAGSGGVAILVTDGVGVP
jgi:hypothetical protein